MPVDNPSNPLSLNLTLYKELHDKDNWGINDIC